MSIISAAQHYGQARKRYKFEMKVHRLVLPTSDSTLVARILWSRRKKHTEKYKTSWIKGKELFVIDQLISHVATIFLTSPANQIQSKYSTIAIEILRSERARSVSGKERKPTKYCSFKLDLSDYINISLPGKIFHKHLKYKNVQGTKKAELVFSIKSSQLNDNDEERYTTALRLKQHNKLTHSHYESAASDDCSLPASGISIISKTSIESSRFSELRRKHVAIQRKIAPQTVPITPTSESNTVNTACTPLSCVRALSTPTRIFLNEDSEQHAPKQQTQSTPESPNYRVPLIVRHVNSNLLTNHTILPTGATCTTAAAESITATTTTTSERDSHETTLTSPHSNNQDRSPYSLYTKYVQKRQEELSEISDQPPPFLHHQTPHSPLTPRAHVQKVVCSPQTLNRRGPVSLKKSMAGAAISICTTSSDDDDAVVNGLKITDIEDKTDIDDDDDDDCLDIVIGGKRLRKKSKMKSSENDRSLEWYKEQMKLFERTKKKLAASLAKGKRMKRSVDKLRRDKDRLEQKVASLQSIVEHQKNEQNNSFSRFRFFDVAECLALREGELLDHRDETGHFLLAKVVDVNEKKKFLFIHYEGWAKKWDVWIDVGKESELQRVAPARSISRKGNTRFVELQLGDQIDLNPTQRHPGWKGAKITKMDKYSGQVQCQYVFRKERYFYWAHLNDRSEIAAFMTRACD